MLKIREWRPLKIKFERSRYFKEYFIKILGFSYISETVTKKNYRTRYGETYLFSVRYRDAFSIKTLEMYIFFIRFHKEWYRKEKCSNQ